MSDPGGPARADGLSVASHLIHLDPGLFSLSLVPGPADRGPGTSATGFPPVFSMGTTSGLPGARVSLPPGPAGRREAAIISIARGDGWLTAGDEPVLIRVAIGGADVMVTLYWSASDGAAPSLRLSRLIGEEAAAGGPPPFPGAYPAPTPPPPAAEIVAHVQGIGDVDGRVGDWVGTRGTGRAIEGFSLTPRQGIAAEDFEIRAVLGRDWLSPWLPGGSFCGSRGLALPLRGFCIRLRPAAAMRHDLNIFARFVDGVEIGPVGAERICAAPSLSPLEAFQVLVRPRVG